MCKRSTADKEIQREGQKGKDLASDAEQPQDTDPADHRSHAHDRARSRRKHGIKTREAPAEIADPLSKLPQCDRQRSRLHIFRGKASRPVANLKHAKLVAQRLAGAPARTAADRHRHTQHESIGNQAAKGGAGSFLSPAQLSRSAGGHARARRKCQASVGMQMPVENEEVAEASACQDPKSEQHGLLRSSSVPHDQYFRELRSRLRERFSEVCEVQELRGDVNAKIDEVMSRLRDNSACTTIDGDRMPDYLQEQEQPLSMMGLDDLQLPFDQQGDDQLAHVLDSGKDAAIHNSGQLASKIGNLDELLRNNLSEYDAVKHSMWSLQSSPELQISDQDELALPCTLSRTPDDMTSSPCPSLSVLTSSDALALSEEEEEAWSMGDPDGSDAWTPLKRRAWTENDIEAENADLHGDDEQDPVQDFAQFCATLQY